MKISFVASEPVEVAVGSIKLTVVPEAEAVGAKVALEISEEPNVCEKPSVSEDNDAHEPHPFNDLQMEMDPDDTPSESMAEIMSAEEHERFLDMIKDMMSSEE